VFIIFSLCARGSYLQIDAFFTDFGVNRGIHQLFMPAFFGVDINGQVLFQVQFQPVAGFKIVLLFLKTYFFGRDYIELDFFIQLLFCWK
jgi:hypothetical protein